MFANSLSKFTILGVLVSAMAAGSVWASDQKCFKKEKLCVEMSWVKAPKKVDMPSDKDDAELLLKFFGKVKKTPAQPKGTPRVQLWMPSMGHGSHPTEVEAQAEKGQFLVKKVYFTMPGEWEIRVILKNGKRKEQVAFPFTL